MKFLVLMWSRLRQYYLKNKLIFIVFLIGGMLNAIVLTYCYGNLIPVVVQRNRPYINYDAVIQNLPELLTEDTLREFLTTDLLSNVMVETEIPADQVPSDGQKCCVAMPYHVGLQFELHEGTRELNSPDQTLAPVGMGYKIGDEVTFFGKTFRVVGIVGMTTTNPNFIIPADTYMELGLHASARRIRVWAAERQNFELGEDAIVDFFEEHFPEILSEESQISFEAPGSDSEGLWMLSMEQAPRILLTYIICSISFVFLLQYLVDSLMMESIIGRIVGASRSAIAVNIFWETALLSVLTGVMGVLVHILLYQPVFQHLNIYDEMTYRAADYGIILFAVLVMSILVVLPIVVKYVSLSPLAARRARE